MTRDDELQAEIQEICDVLRRDQPSASILELWNEALSQHSVRYSNAVRPDRYIKIPQSH